MSGFASIGKNVIVRALGRQANFIEEVTGDIDYEASGCYECPYFIKAGGNISKDCECCSSCPSLKYHIIKKYINEKNRYIVNDRLRLKGNAIKLLVWIYYQRPDSRGVVKNVSFKKLAEEMGVTYRTIINNLDVLRDYKYLCYCKLDHDLYNIWLEDYSSQFEKGGFGYIVINDVFLNCMIKTRNINDLRICIRELMNIDDLNTSGSSFFNAVNQNYKKIKGFLPGYCKNWKIRNIIEQDDSLISSVFKITRQKDIITFVLRDEFSAKKQRKNVLDLNAKKLRSFINLYNENIKEANFGNGLFEDTRFNYLLNGSSLIENIKLSADEIDNLAMIATYYNYESVEKALFVLHEYYILNNISIGNVCGLVRTIIENLSSEALYIA